MTWKKHWRLASPTTGDVIKQNEPEKNGRATGMASKFSSYLPEVYAGHPNRIQRYYQYDDMDRDSDICAALDCIAEFCVQSEEQKKEPFEIEYDDEINETEVKLLTSCLKKWVRKNEFHKRLHYIFRGVLKYGDQFFLRDPETGEWLWLDQYQVEMVKVDDEKGKTPEEYIVRGLDYNRSAQYASSTADPSHYRSSMGVMPQATGRPPNTSSTAGSSTFNLAGSHRDPRQQQKMGQPNANDLHVIDAQHVVHLSLSGGGNFGGFDVNWPFGNSVLEPIYKTYKQKELLEDAIIIYRVQRAPERRVFYIDVGNMPPVRARQHIEQIKNEIHQRRIPNRNGGGTSVIDAAYNPMCFSMDTRVPLLDGRTLSIAELAEEYRAGKENWVFSCDPITGEIMPGNITWAGETRKAAKVIRITLDNGETITCTPDHKIPVLGRGFVEAKDLTPADSLVAFNTRRAALGSGKSMRDRTYTQVYDHVSKKWVFVHRMVGDFFRHMDKHQVFTFLPDNTEEPKITIHHKDFDRYNNDPRNLVFMGKQDHIAFHVFNKKEYWKNISESESKRIRSKISRGLKVYYSSLNEDDRARLSEMSSERNRAWIARMRAEEPEKWTTWRQKAGSGNSKFFKNNPEKAAKRTAKAMANGLNNYQNQSLNVTQRMIGMLVDMVKANQPTKKEAARILSDNTHFLSEVRASNPPIAGCANKIDYEKVSPQRLDLMVEKAGYAGWRDFTRKIGQYNHRITNIEWLDDPITVGTITIDGKERWHSHHTFAIEQGIFVKNSILEDFYFAQSADGRGSKVETLPGASDLGEIGDLSFFTKKMARGLRIPPSYLSLSDDDQTTYNDGKLGGAMIQEFRFTKYCMRLQSLLAPVFDTEFKKFLRDNGIEIDPGIFSLQFHAPQNFTKYRQIELDSAQANVFNNLSNVSYISKQFLLKRFLNLSDDEIIENERLWAKENAEKLRKATGSTPADQAMSGGDLGAIGIRPPSDFGMDDLGDMPPDGDIPAEGGEGLDAPAPSIGPSGPSAGGGGGGSTPPGNQPPTQ